MKMDKLISNTKKIGKGTMKQLNKMYDSWKEKKNEVKNSPTEKIKPRPYGKLLAILFFIGIGWIITNSYLYVEEVHHYLTLAISSLLETKSGIFNSSLTSIGYITILAFAITIFIYLGFLFVLPISFFSIKKEPEEILKGYGKVGLKIIAFAFIPLIINIAFWGDNSDTIERQGEILAQKGNSTWSTFIERISCTFNQDCLLNQKKETTAKQSDRENYEINLIKPDDDYYMYNYLQNNPFYIKYEILSQGGSIFLEKLECYQGDTKEENLLDTLEINEKIDTGDEKLEKIFKCDASNLKTTSNLDENVKIKPVLYFTIDTEYVQKIPIIDVNKYSEKYGYEQEELSISKLKEIVEDREGDTDFEKSNDAVDTKISIMPSLPVILSNNEDYYNEFQIAITFEANNEYKFGKLLSSTLEEIVEPKSISLNSQITTPYDLLTHNDKSIIRFNLDSTSTNIEEEIKTELLKFKISSQFKKEESPIRLTVENPDWVENNDNN